MKIRSSGKSAMATALLADLAAGSTGTPVLEFYSGAMPTAMGEPISGNLLATLTMAAGVGTVTGGIISFGAITDNGAIAIGDIGWILMRDKAGAEALHLTAGPSGSGADVIVSQESVVPGSPISVSLASIAVGG